MWMLDEKLNEWATPGSDELSSLETRMNSGMTTAAARNTRFASGASVRFSRATTTAAQPNDSRSDPSPRRERGAAHARQDRQRAATPLRAGAGCQNRRREEPVPEDPRLEPHHSLLLLLIGA